MKPSIYDAISVEPLYRYDHNAGDRRYARVNERGKVIWYPSVTTIIRATSPTPPGLLAWYIKHGIDGANELRDEAAERGTEIFKARPCFHSTSFAATTKSSRSVLRSCCGTMNYAMPGPAT
jgi:hypothetical protein